MYVAIVHQIKDAQAFLSRGDRMADPSSAPPGRRSPAVLSQHGPVHGNLRVGVGSVEAAREYADSTLGDSSQNRYFEINTEYAVGVPEPVTAKG